MNIYHKRKKNPNGSIIPVLDLAALSVGDVIADDAPKGPVVRYGPNRFSICHPDAGRTLYGLGQQNLAKSDWYSTWGDPIGKAPRYPPLFPELDVARHARNRRLFQSAYALSALVGYEPAVDACGDLFSARLREFAAAGHEGRKKKGEREGAVAINMGHWLQCYAFDVIGLVTYSRRIGFLDRGEDVGGVMKTIEKVATYATLAGVYPWVHPYYFAARQWFQGRAVDGRQYIINWAVASVQEHKEAAASAQQQNESKKAQDTGRNSSGENKPQEEIGGKENEEEVAIGAPDFLTKFFAKHDAYPEAFTPAHILTGTLANIFAGSDTTGIGLSGTLYQLLRNPSALLKLRQEVDNYVSSLPQQQRLNDNEGGGYHISFKATQEDMPYLQAVIKESLRLHIATGMVLERMVPKGGITLAGTFFPEGVSKPFRHAPLQEETLPCLVPITDLFHVLVKSSREWAYIPGSSIAPRTISAKMPTRSYPNDGLPTILRSSHL